MKALLSPSHEMRETFTSHEVLDIQTKSMEAAHIDGLIALVEGFSQRSKTRDEASTSYCTTKSRVTLIVTTIENADRDYICCNI